MGSLNVSAMSASLPQRLILSSVPLPAFPSTGQSAAPPDVIIQPSVGIRTPFVPPHSSSPSFSHPGFHSSTGGFFPVIPPPLSSAPRSYIPPPGPPTLSYPPGSYIPASRPPTMHPPPPAIPPPPLTFHDIIIMPPPPTVVPGPTQGQLPPFPSQSAPRRRSRSGTPDAVVSAPPRASRRTSTVFVPDDPRGRHPSRRRRGTRDEPGSRSRSFSPAGYVPGTSRGRSRSRSRSRLRRHGSESPVIITQPWPQSRSPSPRRREGTRPSVYPPGVPPGAMEPVVVHVPRSRSPSGSPRGNTYDDRTHEPRRRSRSRDRHHRRLVKPRQRSRSRDRTTPIIIAPPAPVVPGQVPASHIPFFVPPTGSAAPVVVPQPPLVEHVPPPSPRSRGRRADDPVLVLPPDHPPERHRDRDRYRHPDDRYEDRFGSRRGSPRGHPYRPYSPSGRYRPSRPHSRSPPPGYPSDPHRSRYRPYTGRSRRYSPSYSSHDSRSRSPSPRGHSPHSGRPRSSRGYPRSSGLPPSRYLVGDHDSSSPPPVVFGPRSRPHSRPHSPPLIIPSPSYAPSGSHRPPTLLPPSRGRSPSRSPVTMVQGPTREQPPILIDDTRHPDTHASSVHIPPVSRSTLRSHFELTHAQATHRPHTALTELRPLSRYDPISHQPQAPVRSPSPLVCPWFMSSMVLC